MKKLHLIRHAKSSQSDGSLADIDRLLNSRGIEACELMAAQIFKAGCRFENVFCSPALRTQTTIELIAQHLSEQHLGEQPIRWTIDEALYTFDVLALMAWCQALDERMKEVVIVGHNDALTDLINQVGDSAIANLPPGGYAQLAVGDVAWQTLSDSRAELVSFLKPKMFL